MARRSPNHPSGLSRDRILTVALEISAGEGIDGLSMRRLAQELDVWPMSLYRYFQDKDALLDAMAAAVAGGVSRPPRTGSWRAQVRALLGDAQQSIAASPGLADRLPRGFLTPDALKLTEAGLAILKGAGFADRSAAEAWRTLWSYTFGFATFRVASERGVRAALVALPDEEYPTLAQVGDELAAVFAADEQFESGLERLLDALEADSSVPGASRTPRLRKDSASSA